MTMPTGTPTTNTSTPAPVENSQPSTPVESTASSSAISEAIVETPAPAESSAPVETPPTEAPAPVVEEVEEYELNLADGSNLSEEDLNEIAAEASRLNLSKEDAEKLLAIKEAAYAKGASKFEADYKAKLQGERAKIEKDPDFIGEKKLETFASINRAVQQFGDAELVALLNTPEVGNNLVIAKFLKRLGDAIAPDSLPGKGTFAKAEEGSDGHLKKLYPDFYK